jgi:hypothetical protein
VGFRLHDWLPFFEVIAPSPFQDWSAALAAEVGAKAPLCPTFLRRGEDQRTKRAGKVDNRKSIIAHGTMMILNSGIF